MENGKPTRTEVQTKLYTDQVSFLGQFRIEYDKAMKGSLPPLTEKYKKMIEENVKFAVPNLSTGLVSPTQTEKNVDLSLIIRDAQIQFIMGEIDEAGWNKALDAWRKAGGDKVIEEMNAEYAKYK